MKLNLDKLAHWAQSVFAGLLALLLLTGLLLCLLPRV